MQYFHYEKNELYGENVRLSALVEQFGTPLYIYSKAALEDNWRAFQNSFGKIPHRICYAVKSNSNIAILNFFAERGAGFDIVSQGELERVLAVGGDPTKIVFSGVAKQTNEIKRALEVGVGCFNVESLSELERIHDIATLQKKIAKISLRINPDIDAHTHPHIATGLSSNKFGIEYKEAFKICQRIQKMPHLQLIGIACHIGSQLTELDPFLKAIDKLLLLHNELKKAEISLQHINIGGGLGAQYKDEHPPTIDQYVSAIIKKLEHTSLEIIIEPGRVLVANIGILLTRVEYIKKTTHKNFAIIDAGMNDFMRPALYDAWHDIIPIYIRNISNNCYYDIVGPICESADFFGKQRFLDVEAGDIFAVCTVGAYGFCMSSNYNSRPRAAEVLIDGDKVRLIRERESIQSLFLNEYF